MSVVNVKIIQSSWYQPVKSFIKFTSTYMPGVFSSYETQLFQEEHRIDYDLAIELTGIKISAQNMNALSSLIDKKKVSMAP